MEYENLDGILVKLVRRYSNIYDKSHSHFKNKAVRENTWSAISQAVRKSKDECHQRWNVLRTRYALEKRKARTEGKPSTWPLYESMTFLDKFMLPRKSYGHYKSVTTTCDIVPAYTIWDEKPDGSNVDPIFINVDSQSNEDIEEKYNTMEHEKEDNTMSSYDTTTMNEKNKDFNISPMENMINPAHIKEEPFENPMHGLKRFRTRTDTNMDPIDAEHAFGKTIALMLKNIRGHKKRRKVQLEIMQVLCKYDSGSDTE